MIKNAYIPIPFCNSECYYCNFNSFATIKNKNEYLNALNLQIKTEYQGENLNTLYLGGGTPSILSSEELKSILNNFQMDENAEVTIEANPEGIGEKYLEDLRELGINRISFGVQTFDDKILKQIGRRHSSKDAVIAVKMAKAVGFDNISIDLIYGLPTQKYEDFSKDLDTAILQDVEHISLYGLKIDKGCIFYSKP